MQENDRLTRFIIAMMVIVQILQTAGLFLFEEKRIIFVYLLVLNIVISILLLRQARQNQIRRFNFIRKINDEAENSLNATLDNMPIGVIRYTAESFEPEWFNPYVDFIYRGNESQLTAKTIQDIVVRASDEGYLAVGDRKYSIRIDEEKKLIYLAEATKEAELRGDYNDARAVIGAISVDNYDDATDLLSDAERIKINSFITSFLEDFTKEKNIYLRRLNAERYYFFSDYKTLSFLMEDKFSILNEFRTLSAEQGSPLTLSIGVSYGFDDFPNIGRVSQNNLELAQVRGGDQVVVRENAQNAHPVYFGGNSESVSQKSRTRARAVATALKTIMTESDNVFIMGHRYPDMDAFGAGVAMKAFANMTGKEAFVVYDEEQLLPDVSRAIEMLNQTEDGQSHILRLQTAKKHKKANSLLIMVDHSKTAQTLNLDFYKSFGKVVVIDHHRRDEDFPNQALLSYIESSASSASELSVELLQFHSSGRRWMSVPAASVVLAGISMDTKGFTKSTTSRTFEAAAYLRSQGADNNLIKSMMATDFEDYKQVNEIVLQAEMVADKMVLSVAPEDKKYDSVTTAKAADTLIDMAGVQAAFALSHHPNGYISISARSFNGFNVQSIMEEMGGGGHFNSSAAQIYEKPMAEVKADLIQIIKNHQEN
ncbi:DHH family phosphoesterase [Lactococcus termiticola]|uniref:Cyclic-di-AMP phosphodiesterase n=1 Tax=Lactococcus termiticola TaxID=2169526 RepID=A0A2R5HH28_9LACT|nr:DHH family phosphoesterase [Lactococcus termiticola]GBG96655.1 DHH family phosphoesterase [Lactococcus termiticola]